MSKSEIISVVTHEDADYVYGERREVYDDKLPGTLMTKWMRSKNDHWLSGSPIQIVKNVTGFELDAKRCEELVNLFDGDINGFYYISAFETEECFKWLMGAVAAEMKVRKVGFDKIIQIIPTDYINDFCNALLANKFEKTFAKNIFADMMNGEIFREFSGENPYFFNRTGVIIEDLSWEEYESQLNISHNDPICCSGWRVPGNILLDEIIKKPEYKAVDSSEVDNVINKVIESNPQQVDKAKNDPKLINWLVGQCMKELKGKASAPDLMKKISELIGG